MAYYEDIILHESGEAECILCSAFIPDSNHCIEIHLNDRVHKELYIKRMMIQNNIVTTQNCVICKICKQDLRNLHDLNSHVKSSLHQSIMRSIVDAVDKDGALIELPENLKKTNAHCSICDHNVNFTLDSIKDHIGSTNHRRARSITVQPFNGIFSVDGNNDHLWCKVCQIYFDNYIEVIFQHVDESDAHMTKLGNMLKAIEGQHITIEKYLTIPGEDKALCTKCGIEVPCNLDNLKSHVKGKKHKLKLTAE